MDVYKNAVFPQQSPRYLQPSALPGLKTRFFPKVHSSLFDLAHAH
jgi:hypothetical protein